MLKAHKESVHEIRFAEEGGIMLSTDLQNPSQTANEWALDQQHGLPSELG